MSASDDPSNRHTEKPKLRWPTAPMIIVVPGEHPIPEIKSESHTTRIIVDMDERDEGHHAKITLHTAVSD